MAPHYDYECENCKQKFEVFQTITAPALEKCNLCEQGPVHRLISGGTGFILAGGGWYRDGYGSAPPAKAPETPAAKPADPAKATEPKTYKKES